MSMTKEFRVTRDVLRLVRDLGQLGHYDWEIAGRLGCDLQTVRNICELHGYEVKGMNYVVTTIMLGVRRELLVKIAREAANRNVSAQVLATQMIERAAADGLFKAILDD